MTSKEEKFRKTNENLRKAKEANDKRLLKYQRFIIRKGR